jgi:hypothetical protein
MLLRPFGKQERAFLLLIPQWREVEKTCDAGLAVIAARVAPLIALLHQGLDGYPGGVIGAIGNGHFGAARIDDVREPILQGLVGGGMSSTEAGSLVRLVFDETVRAGKSPLLEFGYLAFEVLTQALIGLEDEPLGEKKAARKRKPPSRRSPTARPGSSSSTAPPP